MRCEICHGTGKLLLPCPDCDGSGIAHCCDGLRAQPAPHALTEWQRAILTRYVEIGPGLIEPEHFIVVLKIDHQSFRLMHEFETREKAEFMAEQLCIALDRMVIHVCELEVSE